MNSLHPTLVITLLLATLSAAPQGKPVALQTLAATPGKAPAATHRIDVLQVAGIKYLRRETRASSFALSAQGAAGLAMGRDGQFLVTWESRRQRNGMTGVYFQRFDSAGRRRGTESAADAAPEKIQHALAGSLGDQRWLAWESFDKMREGGVLYLGRGGDTASTRPTRIGTGQATSVCLLPRPDGGVVAAFVQLDEFGRPSVWQQTFDAEARAKTPPQALAKPGQRGSLPQLAAHGDDGYLITWAMQDRQGQAAGLALRRFDEAGATVGTTVHYQGRSASGSIEPSIASLADGGLVLAWHDQADSYYDVLAQRFDAELAPVGAAIMVAKAKVRLSGACVAASAFDGGKFCVAWNQGEGDAINQDVMARVFACDGEASGAAFHVNQQRSGDQSLTAADNRHRIAFGPRGELAFAWSGDAGLGDHSAAHLTLMLPQEHTLCDAARDPQQAPLVAATARRERRSGQASTSKPVARPHDPPVFIRHYKQDRAGAPESAGDPGFVAITNTGWTPPDPRIAIGPRHMVEMVNGGIAFFKKDGTRTFFQDINNAAGFWGNEGAKGFVFDPRVLFDAYSGRFIAVCAEHDRGVTPRQGYFCIAVSDDDNPNGTWHKYRFNVTTMAGGYFVDYPQVGVDKEAIYIATNNFNSPFNHTTYILAKAPMLKGLAPPPALVVKNGATVSGAMGAQRGEVPAGIMVSTGGSTRIELHAFRNPLTAPTLTTAAVTVPSFSTPPRVPQKGTTATLWAVDTRIMQTAVMGKRVYAIHTIASGSRAVARWYEFDLRDWPNSGTPRLVQSGNIDEGASVHTFLPGIAVDIYGNVCACYGRSGTNDLPAIGRAFRKVGDTLGTMTDRTVSITSSTFYTRSRWGDYSSVVLDPRDQATFWYCHEYATGTRAWNTWAGQVRVQRPTLTADKTSLSASAGGTLTLSLDNPPYAGRSFVMIAGWSGTSPGIRLASPPGIVNLDVNFDILTTILAANFNTPTFDNFFAKLDASGKATSVFRLPPIPALMGRKLHFAYGQGDAVFDFASETVNLDITL